MIVQLTTYQPPRTPQNGGLDESSMGAPLLPHMVTTYGKGNQQRARLSRHRRAMVSAQPHPRAVPSQQMGAPINFSLFGERERLSNRRRALIMTGAVFVTVGLVAFKAL